VCIVNAHQIEDWAAVDAAVVKIALLPSTLLEAEKANGVRTSISRAGHQKQSDAEDNGNEVEKSSQGRSFLRAGNRTSSPK
jgi:hypothetical protein